MASGKQFDQKMKPYLVYQYLMKHSDENNVVPTSELADMVGRPVHIEIIGLNIVEQKFGDEAKTMVDILKEFKHYRNDKYAKDIKIEIVMGEKKFEL